MTSEPFFRVTPPPDADLRFLLADIEHGKQELAKLRATRVLVDMRGLQRALGDVGNVLLSQHSAEQFGGGLERIAVLVPQRTGHGEAVARRMGLNMMVFTSEAEAVDWLQE